MCFSCPRSERVRQVPGPGPAYSEACDEPTAGIGIRCRQNVVSPPANQRRGSSSLSAILRQLCLRQMQRGVKWFALRALTSCLKFVL